MNRLRAALYHRVSTVDQHPEAARRELRRAAKALGARVVLDVEETGSGANANRAGLARVMEAARARTLDVVIVWKLDRFMRSTVDLLMRLGELEAAGVRFIVTTQGLDVRPGGDPTSRLVVEILSAVAEWERTAIGERTRLGMAAARARGVRLGRRELELPAAVDVFRLVDEGRGRRAIAAELGAAEWAVRRVLEAGRPPGLRAKREEKGGSVTGAGRAARGARGGRKRARARGR